MNEGFAIESVFVNKKFKLKIDNVEEVKEFVNIMNTISEEAILTRGGNVNADAKSIMGVISFDPSQWFYLVFDKFVTQDVVNKFKKWEVK